MQHKDFIDFDEIDKHGPQTYDRTFELTTDDLDRDEMPAAGPVSMHVEAKKGDLPGEYLVDGTASFTADLTCSRCTEPYPFANASEFHLKFRPRPEVSQENEEIEIGAEELDVEFYSERSIPLRDLAAEQIQLQIPMKPLCSDECLGLCPQCGTNRNREACNCDASVIDERWGALAGIRAELAKKNEQ